MEDIGINPEIKGVFIELKKQGHTVGIVTSNTTKNVELFLASHQISIIDFIYSEKNLFGKGKVLNNLIKKRLFKKSEVLYVGDEVRDIDAAKNAAVKVIAVDWGFNSEERLRKAQPDFLISKPREILGVISELSSTN